VAGTFYEAGSKELTVVAALAAPGDSLMNGIEKHCRRKTDRGIVTHTAVIEGRNMIRYLAGGDSAVMTGCTVVNNTCMAEGGSDEGVGIEMAG
jgi:hypothetical protein